MARQPNHGQDWLWTRVCVAGALWALVALGVCVALRSWAWAAVEMVSGTYLFARAQRGYAAEARGSVRRAER